jgi:hypothetical protein
VHEPAGVHRLERLDQAARQQPHRLLRQRPRHRDHVAQREAGDECGREPRRVIIGAVRHHRRGESAADRLRGSHLTAEPRPELRIARQFRVHDFNRHRPPGPGTAEEDPTHPALPEPRLQPERAYPLRITLRERLHPDPHTAPSTGHQSRTNGVRQHLAISVGFGCTCAVVNPL